MTRKTAEATEARDHLAKFLKPGDTVYTILRHVSRSGMMRVVSLKIMVDGEPFDISGFVAKAVGYTLDSRNFGVKVGGCGTDVGFDAVYNLARTLWPSGNVCSGKSCPSNDHSNGDRDYTPHTHEDGGYALRQRWM